jgi:hypothetical protein
MYEDRYNADIQRLNEIARIGKVELRMYNAKLPIEDKLKILVEMQKNANEIRKATGRELLPVWDI